MKIIHNLIIDTSILFPKEDGYKYSLKTLAYNYLKLKIQLGVHDSQEDAKIAMALTKIGIEILPFLKKPIKKKNYESLRSFSKNHKMAVLDFNQHLSFLMSTGIYTEEVKITTEVLDKIIKFKNL